VKTRRGTATPEILSAVVMRRTEKRKKSSSARHCDQIRFRFHPAWVKTRHGERSTGTSVALQIADDFVAQVGRSVRKYCGLLPKARKNGLDGEARQWPTGWGVRGGISRFHPIRATMRAPDHFATTKGRLA
jgi:hypothetical protein